MARSKVQLELIAKEKKQKATFVCNTFKKKIILQSSEVKVFVKIADEEAPAK